MKSELERRWRILWEKINKHRCTEEMEERGREDDQVRKKINEKGNGKETEEKKKLEEDQYQSGQVRSSG